MIGKINYGGMISCMVAAFILSLLASSFAATTTYTYDDLNRKITVEHGQPVAQTYSISGRVTSSGSPLAGVTITLGGGASATTTTDAGGNYGFINLSNGNYTVTPSKANYTFSPLRRNVSIHGADVLTNLDGS